MIDAEKIIDGIKYSTKTAKLIFDIETSPTSHIWYFRKKSGKNTGELFKIEENWGRSAALKTGKETLCSREERPCLIWCNSQLQILFELQHKLTVPQYEAIFGKVEE